MDTLLTVLSLRLTMSRIPTHGRVDDSFLDKKIWVYSGKVKRHNWCITSEIETISTMDRLKLQ